MSNHNLSTFVPKHHYTVTSTCAAPVENEKKLSKEQRHYVTSLYLAYAEPEQYQQRLNQSLSVESDLVKCRVQPDVKSNFAFLANDNTTDKQKNRNDLKKLFFQSCAQALLGRHHDVPAADPDVPLQEKLRQNSRRLLALGLQDQVRQDLNRRRGQKKLLTSDSGFV
jgi:hypothetical protein